VVTNDTAINRAPIIESDEPPMTEDGIV